MSAINVVFHPHCDMPDFSRRVSPLVIDPGVFPKRMPILAIVVCVCCVTAIVHAQSIAIGAATSVGSVGAGMLTSGGGELSARSIPQTEGGRSTRSADALVTLNVEAVPLRSGSLDAVVGLETAYQKVFGGNASIVSDRDKHWQLVVRDAKTGEAIDGLGWGSTRNPVKYASDKDITEGETYADARWDASRPAVNPSTGRAFEPKVMTYGEAEQVLQSAKEKSAMMVYHSYNNSNFGGAVAGTKDFFKPRHVIDDKAMMEWIAKNCQLWASELYFAVDKPTLAEWLKGKAEPADTSVLQPVADLPSTTVVEQRAPPLPSGTVNTAPATQSYTIDNRQLKQQLSQQLESAYQYASGVAAEVGAGAEYQSAVAPVMSQGRSAISSIPDQQTVTVPTQVQPQ